MHFRRLWLVQWIAQGNYCRRKRRLEETHEQSGEVIASLGIVEQIPSGKKERCHNDYSKVNTPVNLDYRSTPKKYAQEYKAQQEVKNGEKGGKDIFGRIN